MIRCGIIELKIDSLYTNFCSSLRGSNIDIIGIYYNNKGSKTKIEFWDNYDGSRLSVDNFSFSDIRRFQDVEEISFRPFYHIKRAIFNEVLFNFLLEDRSQDIEKIFNNSILPGISLIKELESKTGFHFANKTTIHGKKESTDRLFDFSEKQEKLSLYLLKNTTILNNKISKKDISKLVTYISDINRSSNQNKISQVNWSELSKIASTISNKLGTVVFEDIFTEGNLVILGKSPNIDGKIIPIDNPDFTGFSKNELIELADYIQILIEQGNISFRTLQQNVINSIATKY